MKKLNIMTLNVRGLTNTTKHYDKINEIRNMLRANKIDIAILTETHNPTSTIINNYNQIQTGKSKHGILILINKNIEIIKWKEKINGRRIFTEKLKLKISAIYGPADCNYNILKSILGKNNSDLIIGDFNVPLFTDEKSTSLTYQTAKSRNFVIEKTQELDLLDVGRELNNNKHTFFRNGYSSRIDKVYAKSNLIKNFSDFDVITTSTLFDHHTVICSMKLNEKKIFNYWKINNLMLDKKYFFDKIERTIKSIPFKIKEPKDWDEFKYKMKMKVKKIQKFYFHQRNKKLKKLKDLQKMANKTMNEINPRRLQIAKNEIRKMNNEISKINKQKLGHMIEKSKLNKVSKQHIKFAKATESKIIMESKIDIKTQEEYYNNIFNCNKHTDINTLEKMLRTWNNKLTDEEKEFINRPITIAEIKTILLSRNSNSSPGPDGLSYKFYKKFKNVLLAPLCELYNLLLKGSQLTNDMKTSYTIPIYKKKGDINQPENWRPIALSNTDYKIYTSILNNRLMEYSPKLISKNQTGFSKNRFIIDNILIINETLKSNQYKYAILCLDIAKAFDTINHLALFKILEHVNTGNFTKCIKEIYNNTMTRIIHNGSISNPITIRRGVKQGDVISPLLFNIGIELMTKNIIRYVKGVTVHGTKVNIVQYADDTTIICGSNEDINNAFRTLEDTKRCLHLETNYKKSTVILKKLAIPYEIKTANEERILGYLFNKRQVINNIDNLLLEMINRGKKWRKFGGDLKEKTTIWNVFILSKIWYWLWGLSPTTKQIHQLKNIQNWFIFNKSLEYNPNIKYVMQLNQGRANKQFDEGGLGLYYYKDKIKSLKINLIDRALKNNELLSEMVHNLLKRGTYKQGSPLSRYVEYYIKFYKKRLSMISEDVIPAWKVYYELIYKKESKVKLTENQLKVEKTLRFKFVNIWKIINEMKIPNKQRFFLWRYFNNVLPIPRTKNCKLCNSPLKKQHILFDCKVIREAIKDIKINKYCVNIKNWSETKIIIQMIKDIYHDKNVNYQKYRTQIGILLKTWNIFTEIQYGERKLKDPVKYIQETVPKYVTEANWLYRSKKKKNQKEIQDIKEVNKAIPIIMNEDYALLINNFKATRKR